MDFRNIEGKIYVEPEIALKILHAVREDTKFFEKHGIMDYSLLLIIADIKDDNVKKEYRRSKTLEESK